MASSIFTAFNIPNEMHARMMLHVKRLKMTKSVLLREALHAYLNDLDRKYIDEHLTREAGAMVRMKGTKLPTLEERLAPRQAQEAMKSKPAAPVTAPAGGASDDKLSKIYRTAARDILLAGDDTLEIKRLVLSVQNKIKKEFPLTCPPDVIILSTIEREVIRQRDEGPTELVSFSEDSETSYNNLVGRVVKAAKAPPTPRAPEPNDGDE